MKDGCKGWWRPFIKKIPVTYVLKKHRAIGLEHRENTGNLILTRMWPPCFYNHISDLTISFHLSQME